MKSFLGAFLVIIGWFMTLGGLGFAIAMSVLLSSPYDGTTKPFERIIGNIVVWAIPIAGLLLILFSNKIIGYKDTQK